LNIHLLTNILVATNLVNVVKNSTSSYRSNAEGGIGISATLNILLAPDLVEYNWVFSGVPPYIGNPILTANFWSIFEQYPGIIYAFLPSHNLLIFLIVLSLYYNIFDNENVKMDIYCINFNEFITKLREY